MPVKILFQKELSIDLNAYYSQFPRRLRLQIDEAVMGLVSGSRTPSTKSPVNGARHWRKEGDGFRLTSDVREIQLRTTPSRGDMLVAFNALKKRFGADTFTMLDAKKELITSGVKPEEVSTCLSKLWACRNIDVSALQEGKSHE